MPEPANHKIAINVNILKPQNESQKSIFQALHWILFVGRYLIIVVEIIVLAAFLTRFKFDADIADTQERIDEQIAPITAQKDTEIAVRQTQFQISQIRTLKQAQPDFSELMQHIAAQTPTTVTLSTVNVESASGKSTAKITGSATSNNEVATLTQGLKQDPFFQDVALSSISLEQSNLKFVVTAVTQSTGASK